MGSAEEQARRDAVMRVLAGEPPSKIAADSGRSDRWVRKWVTRYDPGNENWAVERSRAPKTQSGRTAHDIEALVLQI
ncbi:MAG: helix-turn-helix domain-containing protein, partial [Actinomycetota bacterium]